MVEVGALKEFTALFPLVWLPAKAQLQKIYDSWLLNIFLNPIRLVKEVLSENPLHAEIHEDLLGVHLIHHGPDRPDVNRTPILGSLLVVWRMLMDSMTSMAL